jgi:hypothetical protein
MFRLARERNPHIRRRKKRPFWTRARKAYLIWGLINLTLWIIRSILSCDIAGESYDACSVHFTFTSTEVSHVAWVDAA